MSDAMRTPRLGRDRSQRLSQRQLEAVRLEDGAPRGHSFPPAPSSEVVQEAERKLVASDKSSPGDEVFSAEARAIIDPRSISFRAVKNIYEGVIRGDLVPDVELFEATRDFSEKITAGTTIEALEENDDGSRKGRVYYADEQVTFVPGEDAKVKERHDWATEDIAQYVVPALITNDKQIYLQHLDDADVGGEFQGTFVSQARAKSFRDLVAAMEAHFDDKAESAFVWLDIFSANQPELTRRDKSMPDETKKAYEEYMTAGLHRAIAKFEELVVVFDRWDIPAPLQRAWCVWEVLGAVKAGRPLRIVITPGEEEGFEKQLRTNPGEIAKTMADNNDMRKAKCHKAEDQKMIDDAVKDIEGDFTTLNMVVNDRVREWHMQMARHAVDKARQREDEEGLADILRSAGDLFFSQSSSDKALACYEEAMSNYKESLGDRRPDVAQTLHNIANVYANQGRHEEALAKYDEALSIRKEVLGDRHPFVANTLNGLASVYYSQGRYEEALAYYEEALLISKEALGDRHPSVAGMFHNIANVYKEQGRYEEALAYYEEALSIRKEALGDRHPSVANALNNIAIVYKEQGRYEEALANYEKALAYYEKALSIRKEAFGDRNPEVAVTLCDIAIVYQRQGRYEEALAYYEKALSIDKEALGDRHRDVADTLNNIIIVYKEQGRYDEALAYCEKALTISKEVLGDRHPDVSDTLNNIIIMYKEQGRYDEALAYCEEDLSISKEALGDRHPSVATRLNNIAGVYRRQGRYDEALAYDEEALSIRIEALGYRHLSVAQTLFNIANVYSQQGRYKEALAYYEENLSISKEAFRDRHPSVANTFNNMRFTRERMQASTE
ncbi:Kinesin light chain 3 [Hondaea fermentalgiana]|uniref:Kinesin light chain 3 n=1 Tax=Hondaea fermentalgiana TaxID=2315210 RepID=A0A2R5GU76_9STRA|nr:Kinesin light chain 3 [Hondaea fermentalgiana]|eukprot:GBG33308.1 Kinesin light chain 3 [Hondaea fermentalgiana]